MGRNPARLNQKQVEVLRWVEDGCPIGGDEEGYERLIVARALERRGLIAIKGHGVSWSASITKGGLAWLATHPGMPPTDAEVNELIRRVQAGDGRLVLPEGGESEMAHEQLVKMSEHSASRPRGWRLEMRATGPWADRRKEIILVRQFEDLVDEVPVPVPSQVPRYHPTVKAFLADRDRQLVSNENLARAARILKAIVDEAPRRGLKLLSKAQATIEADAYRRARSAEDTWYSGHPPAPTRSGSRRCRLAATRRSSLVAGVAAGHGRRGSTHAPRSSLAAASLSSSSRGLAWGTAATGTATPRPSASRRSCPACSAPSRSTGSMPSGGSRSASMRLRTVSVAGRQPWPRPDAATTSRHAGRIPKAVTRLACDHQAS